MEKISIPVDMSDEESLIQAAATSLCSKVVSQHVSLLAPIAVKAVLSGILIIFSEIVHIVFLMLYSCYVLNFKLLNHPREQNQA